MSLPLYRKVREEADAFDNTDSKKGHIGLRYERFYDAYPQEISNIKPKDDFIEKETQWLEKFRDKKIGNEKALEHKALQQMALCKALSGRNLFASTQWHFVTGMGLPHPIENGMAWHPTLGVPFLSGAAVKGIVRAWLEVWEIEQDETEQKERLWEWFGSDDKDPKKQSLQTQAGALIFFDALPVESPILTIDVMTPHMGKWYAEGQTIKNAAQEADKVPADWHNPVPVKFLVAKKINLHFCIAPRHKKYAEKIDMSSVMGALQNALEWAGAGAKTAVGYGCFEQDEKMTDDMKEKRKEQKQQQKDKSEDAALKKDSHPLFYQFSQAAKKGNWQNSKDAFCQNGVVEGWISKLEAEPNPVPELRKKMVELMDTHFKGVMNNPDAVKGKKNNKSVYKPRVKMIAKRLIALGKKEIL